MIQFSFLFISLSILVLCLAFRHHVKTCRILTEHQIFRLVYVLRTKTDSDVFSIRAFSSYDKMIEYMNDHSLPDGFEYIYELLECNRIG